MVMAVKSIEPRDHGEYSYSSDGNVITVNESLHRYNVDSLKFEDRNPELTLTRCTSEKNKKSSWKFSALLYVTCRLGGEGLAVPS